MKHTLFSRLLRDRGGNFGVMTAAMLPVLLGVAGMAIDVTNAMQEKNRLQALADSATLAAASAMADTGEMSEAEAETMATGYFLGQELENEKGKGASDPEIEAIRKALEEAMQVSATTTASSNTAASYEVRMKLNYDLPLNGLTGVLGFKTMKIAVESYARSGREGNALSMYLALDESGSMKEDTTTVNPAAPTKQVRKSREEEYNCGTKNYPITCKRTVYYYEAVPNYLTKMASLKAAAAAMFAELDKADPNKELIRVGGDSYTHETKTEQKIQWGTTDIAAYVKKLPEPPSGGTDASGAMTNALNALKKANATEKTAHDGKGNTNFDRYIVLMTDGEMTGNSSSWNSTIDKKVRALCDQAKADGLTDAEKADGISEEEKARGIKIYAIAFMAPERGKALLNYCASGEDYYYEPSNMTQLVQSFGEIARKAAKTGTRLTN
ncbi:pilus assembly protein TadG-related protein [Neorhizobium sp. CSC1952]|nr:TadE/TadG family type IV pilus assembly protein [Rhizobium sp. CSC1952]WJR69519.1 pilus assembly protein TadG-related protein [Rhizobium sp. CSC1952]